VGQVEVFFRRLRRANLLVRLAGRRSVVAIATKS